MSRVKVYIELILHEEGNRKLITTLEKLMSIDVPHVGDFIYVSHPTMATVASVRHRDEHWPEVRLEDMEFGRQPDKDAFYKDQRGEEIVYYEIIRGFKQAGWREVQLDEPL